MLSFAVMNFKMFILHLLRIPLPSQTAKRVLSAPCNEFVYIQI